jgi:hypothetical protein
MDKLSTLMNLLDIDDSFLNTRGITLDTINFEPDEDLFIDKTDKICIEVKKDKKPRNAMKDLVVRSVVKEEDDYELVHPHLPKIPFSLLNCGTRGAGKTVLCLQLLEWYSGVFDNIFIFSPTIELDFKYKLMFEKLGIDFKFGQNIFIDYNEGILNKIMNKIKRFNKGKPFKMKSKTLFIFDDIVSSIPKNKRRTIFNRLILNNRHYNASVIINSQTFKLLDSNFRKVSSQIVLFRTDNVAELYAYAEELSAILGRKRSDCIHNFLKIYDIATKDPFSFMYINYHHKDKFFKNMDTPLKFDRDTNSVGVGPSNNLRIKEGIESNKKVEKKREEDVNFQQPDLTNPLIRGLIKKKND